MGNFCSRNYLLKFRKLNFQEIKELKGDITPLCSVRS